MSESEIPVHDQLVTAVRDLWSSVIESGDTYVVFMDHRRMATRVEMSDGGLFRVSWEAGDGEPWLTYERQFENPREAAFHGFQGPH